MRHLARALSLAGILLVLSCPLLAQTRRDSRDNPKYRTAISDGQVLAEDQEYDLAIDAYAEANRIAGGKDKFCLRNILELQIQNGDYDNAVVTAGRFEALAATPAEKSYAAASRGRALFLKAEPEKNGAPYDAALLAKADDAFKAALAADPKDATALFQDGEVLVHLGQAEEARARFKACVAAIKPGDALYLRAERFADNPALALEQLAPAFTVKTLDGARFDLDQMQGRVVLIDFWATWCVPCMKELPEIKKIAKDFSGQPLVILSVSWDEDEQTWQDFVEKNQMTWPQYRDVDHKLGRLFEVEGIPSYYTIDSNGVIASELMGEGFDVESRLRKLIVQAKNAKANSALAAIGQ
ncbi:hypothetical protein GCM10011507_18940 [Edaphobacter acidisoli]|uniref:Thioredoxin domain-containing protein n=1 Tax=Edaphobacter acidisoli TaxID=2040573 RepID=A0A916RS53_9BACT|nr:TlpA disulfide reductase family protein [Edaphobacter acidisoli]GGA67602.1 hypothetical protein GCM10011507_18940 [Edaphobacter acidisoli]